MSGGYYDFAQNTILNVSETISIDLQWLSDHGIQDSVNQHDVETLQKVLNIGAHWLHALDYVQSGDMNAKIFNAEAEGYRQALNEVLSIADPDVRKLVSDSSHES